MHRNIFLFNKTNRRTNFPKFIFVKNLYMFRAVPLPIIRSFSLYIRHWYMSCRFDDSFQARPGWNWFYSVAGGYIPVPNVQWKIPDDGQRNCPKHVEFRDKNKFGKLVRLVGFIKKKVNRLTQDKMTRVYAIWNSSVLDDGQNEWPDTLWEYFKENFKFYTDFRLSPWQKWML